MTLGIPILQCTNAYPEEKQPIKDGVIIEDGGRSVASPLVNVDPGAPHDPVDMAFSHDGNDSLPCEPSPGRIRQWPMDDPEKVYWTYLRKLNNGRAFCDWDDEYGALAWGESFILHSLLNMFEATGKSVYLGEFVIHADAVIAQGADEIGRPDYRGLRLPGWGMSGYMGIGKFDLPDKSGKPAVRITGRTRQWHDEISIRLRQETAIAQDVAGKASKKKGQWSLSVHRSVAGRQGIILSDKTPLSSSPDWNVSNWRKVLDAGDSLAFDTLYPWLNISEIRLYGIGDESISNNDLEVYVGMHADRDEYTRVDAFSIQNGMDFGEPFIALRFPNRLGRYWKVRWLGKDSLPLHADRAAVMRLYWMVPLSEQFREGDLETLQKTVEQKSELIRMEVFSEPILRPSPKWQFLDPQRFRYALHNGLISYPLLLFANLVRQHNLHDFLSDANQYFSYAKAVIDNHDNEWRNISAEHGYYLFPEGSPVWLNGVNLPFNQQAAIGRSLLMLWDLTGEERYRSRAAKIARVLLDDMYYNESTNSYSWHNTFAEGREGWKNKEGRIPPTWEGVKGPETIWYASLDVDFACLAYERNIVFSQQDMIRLSNTFLRRLTTGDGKLHKFVTGEESYSITRTAVEFLCLTRINPAVYQRVEKMRLFPPSIQDGHRTPYTISQLVKYAP